MSLGDHQQVEPAHSEEALDVLLVTVGAVWEKEAFFVPGAPARLFHVLPRQFEQLDESRGLCVLGPQCGSFLFQLFRSRFSGETYCFGAYQRLVLLGLHLTDESSQPIFCSAL